VIRLLVGGAVVIVSNPSTQVQIIILILIAAIVILTAAILLPAVWSGKPARRAAALSLVRAVLQPRRERPAKRRR